LPVTAVNHPNGAAHPRERSEFQIADFRFRIWNLRFAICNPEGRAFVPEGLYLDRWILIREKSADIPVLV
jgi:hypothetical protein